MPRTGKYLLSTLALAVLLGCETEPEPTVDLTLTCQLTECICKGDDGSMFKKPSEAPLLWTERGQAYCPEGFALELVEKK